MKKKLKILGLLTVFFFLLILLPVNAQKKEPPPKKEIPEVAGTYDDPDHPGIKVRVFVYKTKPDNKPVKPPEPTPLLRCDLDDPESTNIVAKERWVLPDEWSYNLNPNSVPLTVGKSNLEIIAKNAFDRWSDATEEIFFKKGKDTKIIRQAYDGINLIAWGQTRGTALAVTYIRFYPDNGAVVDVDTIMNNKFKWSWSNSTVCAYENTYDAENILTHELGHWIGLDDMYDITYFQHATMYGYGAPTEVKKITLSAGDKTGAYQIYH